MLRCGIVYPASPSATEVVSAGVLIIESLLARDCLEDHPALVTVHELVATIADRDLLEGLRRARAPGGAR
ncbi:MAG TPA: hypothetical protein EYH34_11390 [Planctomycetes bacterium]|nr:hypothetical protein [Planctomycetota bacterium]